MNVFDKSGLSFCSWLFFLCVLGCGSDDLVEGRLSYLDNDDDGLPLEMTPSEVIVRIYDHQALIRLRKLARVELGKRILEVDAGTKAADFVRDFHNHLFSLLDTASSFQEVETDDEGRFRFSFPGNECLLVAKCSDQAASESTVDSRGVDDAHKWFLVIRRHDLASEGVDLRTQNKVEIVGAHQFISTAEIQDKLKSSLNERKTRSGWQEKIAQLNAAEVKKTWLPTLSHIPPGTFSMGHSSVDSSSMQRSENMHDVTILHGFWIGMHEVTNGQWKAAWGIPETNPSTADLPVASVSHADAVAFCWKLTELARLELPGQIPPNYVFRLPTEAEWEYASRGGTEQVATIFGSELSSENANYGGGVGSATKVGSYKDEVMAIKPLPRWILYDMHGNVREWCHDWYADYTSEPTINPIGPIEGKYRIHRGGGFRDLASQCYSASRQKSSPISRRDDLGLRVVLGYPL